VIALEFRFAFHARDFEKSTNFYREVMGFQSLEGGWDRPDGKGALFSVGGTGVIEIYGAAEGRAYVGPSPTAINLALRLEDAAAVDAFHAMLQARGVDGLEPPQDRLWGHRSFIVHDPDGIPIHIYCELPSK
jgi:catechol 2,3-dioxygenase-like lactoylglutathione lyase family enzyme